MLQASITIPSRVTSPHRSCSNCAYSQTVLSSHSTTTSANLRGRPALKLWPALFLDSLARIVTSKSKLKFSLLASSYDNFLGFFELSNLISASPDFYGLLDYASSMAFELFTPDDTTSFPSNLNIMIVRFFFRIGSIRRRHISSIISLRIANFRCCKCLSIINTRVSPKKMPTAQKFLESFPKPGFCDLGKDIERLNCLTPCCRDGSCAWGYALYSASTTP